MLGILWVTQEIALSKRTSPTPSTLLPVAKEKALQIVEDYIELIKEALEKESKVLFSGFGSYEVRHKPGAGAGIHRPGNRSSCGRQGREVQTQPAAS